jgi:hypothetical protein
MDREGLDKALEEIYDEDLALWLKPPDNKPKDKKGIIDRVLD